MEKWNESIRFIKVLSLAANWNTLDAYQNYFIWFKCRTNEKNKRGKCTETLQTGSKNGKKSETMKTIFLKTSRRPLLCSSLCLHLALRRTYVFFSHIVSNLMVQAVFYSLDLVSIVLFAIVCDISHTCTRISCIVSLFTKKCAECGEHISIITVQQ